MLRITLSKLVDTVIMNQSAEAKLKAVDVETTGTEVFITITADESELKCDQLVDDISAAFRDEPVGPMNGVYTVNGKTYTEKELKKIAEDMYFEFARMNTTDMDQQIGVNGRGEWIVRVNGCIVFIGPMHDAINCYNSND